MTQEPSASEMLIRFVRDRDEAAFAELVHRYAGLVHAAALRRTNGHSGLAEDASQLVFLELARNAARLRPDTQLGGWLHRCTLSITSDLMKSERRRSAREDRAASALETAPSGGILWGQTAPMIDDVLEALTPRDRDAVILRFFEGQSFQAIGERLGTTEDTAHKRVSRALERMRTALHRRGIVSSSALLAGFLSAHAAPPPPPGLAEQVLTMAGRSFEALPISLHSATAPTGAPLSAVMKLTRKLFPAALLTVAGLSPLIYLKITSPTPETARKATGAASLSRESPLGTGTAANPTGATATAAPGAAQTVGSSLTAEEVKREETRRTAEARAKERTEQRYEDIMEQLRTKLHLTPEQDKALADYHQSQRGQWVSYMVGATLHEADPSLYHLEVGYRERVPAELQSLLTPEQLESYREWDQRRRTNHAEAFTTGEIGSLAELLDLSSDQKDQLFASLGGINSTDLFQDFTGIRTLEEIAAQADRDISRRREAFAPNLTEKQLGEWEKVVASYKKSLLERFGGKTEAIANTGAKPSTGQG